MSKKKDKKLSDNAIRVKIYRLLNGTPIEIGNFMADTIRDNNNNTIIFNEEMNFKEEMVGSQDSLVNDILYKLESRGATKDQQLKLLETAIAKQEKIVKSEKNGYIVTEVESIDEDGEAFKENKKIKINKQTEKSKLNVLKCSLYALKNKKGDGFFETIDIDGTRSLSYVIMDGEFVPYWYKTPTSKGQPVVLVPDVTARKKFYKEASDEAIQDFNESVDWAMKGWIGVVMRLLVVVAFAGLIIWTIFLARWNSDLYDNSLEPKIQELELENQRIKQRCTEQIAQQMENNMIIFDYAKLRMEQEKSVNLGTGTNTDKANIQI